MIERGVIGEFSKIKEEFLELEDAIYNIKNDLHTEMEISDLLGAIQLFVKNKCNNSFEEILHHSQCKIEYFKESIDGLEE